MLGYVFATDHFLLLMFEAFLCCNLLFLNEFLFAEWEIFTRLPLVVLLMTDKLQLENGDSDNSGAFSINLLASSCDFLTLALA